MKNYNKNFSELEASDSKRMKNFSKKTKINEEGVLLETSGSFYNPEMKFCRSIFSLAVGAVEEKIKLLDAFCASGARGIRYAKENKNITASIFLDWSKNAIKLSKKNVKKNSIKNTKFATEDINWFLINNFYEKKFDFDFVELDPFGTPAPYLYPVFYSLQRKKVFYLSATATDTAVLCGPETEACVKNYHSRRLNNEFTHENGLRILVKRIAEVAAEFNFGITPLFSVSDRHYLKTIVKCEVSAVKTADSMKKLGYISCCSCGWRTAEKRMRNSCKRCGKETEYGGKLWLGELSDRGFVAKMEKLNKLRKYSQKMEISSVLGRINGEIGLPPWYFNVHRICKRIETKEVPKLELVLERLRKKGFAAVRTHFSDVSIKTNAPVETVEKAVKG